ncbi:DUF429 domain-containing protein [Algihabitans sp.]|uniref:DUF429 domain-containing protein n=1 Tax=Algihabitans sp. TaxID=2821514 RepID=UPI003BA91EF4
MPERPKPAQSEASKQTGRGRPIVRGEILTLGLDGCRAGWIVAAWLGPGSAPRFQLLRHFSQAAVTTGDLAGARQIAIDIPIGLPDSGRRACDLAARAALPPGARSRVFLDLRRPQIRYLPADYPGANAWSKTDGSGLSKQAWFILPKVAEVDSALTPEDQTRVREVHPEVVFHRLAGGLLLPSKKTPEGRKIRLQLLAEAGLAVEAGWDRQFPRKEVQLDDLIDAAVCALAARRILDGKAKALPLDGLAGASGRDSRGLAMEIWA